MLSPDLLDLLRCPRCHGPLHEQARKDGEGLVCRQCRLFYAVNDGLPCLLIDEARPLEDQPELM